MDLVQADSQKKLQPFDWKALIWSFVFFWYFSGVIQAVIFFSGSAGFTGFRNSFYLSVLWLVPLLLFHKRAKLLAAIIGLVLWAASLVSISYYTIYGQEFSQSVIFVMFESNTAEASEYLSQYFSFKLLAILVVYSVVGFLLWRKVRPVVISNKFICYAVCLAILASIIVYPFANRLLIKQNPWSVAFDKFVNRMEPAVPWQLAVGYYQYNRQLANMQELLDGNKALPPLANLTDATGNKPRTLVLVIGESTSRAHMSLYGYPRETNPQLKQLQKTDKGLTVFNDVVAPRPYTIEVLQQVLTFADQKNPDAYLTTPSIINLMKQAGYKTFWITNQQTMTKRNTMLTTFSQMADEQVYLNNDRNQNANQYDGVVFDPFKKALADAAPKKFIIIHLLGTHMNYKYRYPEQFAQFKGKDKVVPAALDEKQAEFFNNYDNAVLYNDYVISTLIKDFKATDPYGFLVYFSDHGEEVYGDAEHEVLGRNEGAPTPGMYTVPFMVWNSASWQQDHARDLKPFVNRPYGNSYFIHTWSDLAGLSYDMYDAKDSLVSKDYVARTRWIGNPQVKLLSYDKLFTKKPKAETKKDNLVVDNKSTKDYKALEQQN